MSNKEILEKKDSKEESNLTEFLPESLSEKYVEQINQLLKQQFIDALADREDLSKEEKEKILAVEFWIIDKYTTLYLKQRRPEEFVKCLLDIQRKLKYEGLKYNFWWSIITIKPREVFFIYDEVNLYRAFNPYVRLNDKNQLVIIWGEGWVIKANWDKAIIIISPISWHASMKIDFYLKERDIYFNWKIPFIHWKEKAEYKFSTVLNFFIRS